MGIGFAMLFSALALVGVVVMVAGLAVVPFDLGPQFDTQAARAWGFAVAMAAAAVAVVAPHAFSR